MRRTRMIATIGIIGTILCLGFWVHSLTRVSGLRLLMSGNSRTATIGFSSGSVYFTRSNFVHPNQKRVQRISVPFSDQPNGPGKRPDSRLGRFSYELNWMSSKRHSYFVTREVPIWFLNLLALLILWPFYRRARNKQGRSASPTNSRI